MPIPTLPTDNLYKFLAVGGVCAALLVLWFSTTSKADATKQMITAEREVFRTTNNFSVIAHEAGVEMLDSYRSSYKFHGATDERFLEVTREALFLLNSTDDANQLAAIDLIGKEHADFVARAYLTIEQNSSEEQLSESDQVERQERSREIELRIRTIFDKYDTALQEVTLAETELLLASETMDSARELQFASKIIVPVGFLISIAGFILWWFRFQRYQDAIARSQAKTEK